MIAKAWKGEMGNCMSMVNSSLATRPNCSTTMLCSSGSTREKRGSIQGRLTTSESESVGGLVDVIESLDDVLPLRSFRT